jgi:pimeloyl-ACP methyl ester carboxylesterase
MAPVAREISRFYGMIEPIKIEQTLSGQVEELKTVLECQGNQPGILVGHSWGAMPGFIFTAENPAMVKKLILVSSGVFEDRYVEAS